MKLLIFCFLISVKTRIESTQGISFTEFSYQLLQAYDFWYLYQNHGCRIQVLEKIEFSSACINYLALARRE